MKLKKLIVHGFKSFRDRTTIDFDLGITGIVGPNGCGKSNIVDALFWVMGEMSAKHLRGNNMRDVIFAGSSKFNPSPWAEVSLVLENNEGKHIHIGNRVANPSEIQLTRKLYRNGETEYRINNEPCRLKDIQEVFMDTGAGAKSYSIIAQGEISRLVQAKPVERRIIIEEVAGITKFNLRKKESQRKIEQTKSNLERLKDLQTEIEKNIHILRDQAENAQKAKTLKEKIKRGELVVGSHKVFDLLKENQEKKAKHNQLKMDLENLILEKEQIEVSLQNERLQKEEKNQKLDQYQAVYNEQSKKLAAAEERLHFLMKSLTDKENRIESIQKELVELNEDKENRTKRLGELLSSETEVLGSENKQEELDLLQKEIAEIEEQLTQNREVVDSSEKELKVLRDKTLEFDQILFKDESKIDEYSRSLQDLNKEIEELEILFSSANTEITEARDRINEQEKHLKVLTNDENDRRVELTQIKEDFSKKEDQYKKKHSEWLSVNSKYESLKELIDNYEGLKDGTADFLKSAKGEGYSLLGSVITCKSGYELAMNTLLNDVIDNAFSLENCFPFDWLKENTDQSLDILIPDTKQIKTHEMIGLIPMSEIVKGEEKYLNALAPLFANRFVFDVSSEQIDDSTLRKLEEVNFDFIVSNDGKLLIEKKMGALNVRANVQNEGLGNIIERNNRASELKIEKENLSEEIIAFEKELEVLEGSLEVKNLEYEKSIKKLMDFKVNFAAKKSAFEEKVNAKNEGDSRLQILRNRRDEFSKLKVEVLENNERNKKEKLELDTKLFELKRKYDLDMISLKEKETRFQTKKEEFFQINYEVSSFNERLKAVRDQKEDVQKQLERIEHKINNNTNDLSVLKEEIIQVTKDCEELERNNLEEAKDLEDKADALSFIKEELNTLSQGMADRENKVRDINKKTLKFEKEIDQNEVRFEKILQDESDLVRDIFEKYQVDLREVITSELQYPKELREELMDISSIFVMETEDGPRDIIKQEYEFVRKYGQELKDTESKVKSNKSELLKFGEINWKAVEDYERQKLRFDFIKAQEVELRSSLEDLERAIDHIDTNSKQRFKQAFEEVNERFRKVFPIIFGGGNASLQITGDLDDPDCGVDIIAQPPGKKMQNINLMSGGEKALTALSLIFSVFLVKPSPFCLLDEVDAPLDDANVGRFNDLLREMSNDSQFILITHNKKTMELNDILYGVTMQEPGISKAVSIQLQ